MKTILSSLLLALITTTAFSQGKKITVLNDSTELQQYDDGQSLKVRYLLNGSAISLKDKDDLLAKEGFVHQEFNIKTIGKEVIGEINLMIDGAAISKKEEPAPVIIPPNSINIFSNLDGTSFPGIDWKGLDGSEYSLAKLKGKVVVFNFWHTSCGPCIAEMPLLNELVRQYAGKDVVFIACTSNSEAQAKKFLQRTGFGYKQVAGIDPQTIFDPFPGWPIHIVIDKNGLIRFHALGKQPGIEQKLQNSINESLRAIK